MHTSAWAGDVAAELGRELTASELVQVERWLDRVKARIRRRIPDLDQRILDPDYAATVNAVTAAVVARRVANPEGMRSERVDDYYYDREASAGSSDLTLTAEEWADLMPPSAIGGAFTVRPTFAPDGC